MAEYSGMILTDQGKNLFLRAQAGEQIVITRCAFGDAVWDYSGETGDTDAEKRTSYARKLTGVVTEKQSFNVSSIVPTPDTAKVTAMCTNDSLTEGYEIREIGVYAQDPDDSEAEILYCVTNTDMPDYMPAIDANNLNKVEQLLIIYIAVGQADNVTAIIDGTVILVTQVDLEAAIAAHITSDDAHKELFEEFRNMDEVLKLIGSPDDFPAEDTTLFAGQQKIFNFVNAVLTLFGRFEHPDLPTVSAYLQEILDNVKKNSLKTEKFDKDALPDQEWLSVVHSIDDTFNREVKILEKVAESGEGNYVDDFNDQTNYELERIDNDNLTMSIGEMPDGSGKRLAYFTGIELSVEHLGYAVYSALTGSFIGAILEIVNIQQAYLNYSGTYSGEVVFLPAEVKEGKFQHYQYNSYAFYEYTGKSELSEELENSWLYWDFFAEYRDPNDTTYHYTEYETESDPKFISAPRWHDWYHPHGYGNRLARNSLHGGPEFNPGLTSTGKEVLNQIIDDAIAEGISFIDLRADVNHSVSISYLNGSGVTESFSLVSGYHRFYISGLDYILGSFDCSIDIPSISVKQSTELIGGTTSLRWLVFEKYKSKNFPLGTQSNQPAEAKTNTIDTNTWSGIKDIEITSSDDVKLAFSMDDGVTWKKYVKASNEWISVANASEGNTKAEINDPDIDNAELDPLLGMGSYMKLALYIPAQTSYFEEINITYSVANQYKPANESDFQIRLLSERNTKVQNVSGSPKDIRVIVKDIKKE